MKVRFTAQGEKAPEQVRGVRVPYASSKRVVSQWRWYLIVLIVSAPLLYFLGKIVFSAIFITAPGYLSFEKMTINSAATGIIEKIVYPEGSIISKDTLVMQLKNTNLEDQLLRMQTEKEMLLEYSDQTSQLPEKQEKELSIAQMQQRRAEKMLDYQKNFLAKVRFLRKQGAASIAELRQAEAGYISAMYTMEQAQLTQEQIYARTLEQQNKHLREQKNNKEDISGVKLLDIDIAAAQKKIKNLGLTIPYKGRILEYLVNEGQAVSQGTPLMILAEQEEPTILCYLSPRYTEYAHKGQKVSVKFSNNTKIEATVKENAKLVKRLPQDFAGPISSRELTLLVKLSPLTPIATDVQIDGLPITAHFKTNWLQGLNRIFY